MPSAPFVREEGLFPIGSPPIASRCSIGADDAVAGDQKGHRIGRACPRNRTCGAGAPDATRDFFVTARGAARNALKFTPHPRLECRRSDVDREPRVGSASLNAPDDRFKG